MGFAGTGLPLSLVYPPKLTRRLEVGTLFQTSAAAPISLISASCESPGAMAVGLSVVRKNEMVELGSLETSYRTGMRVFGETAVL
jgi:hypothetical protein